jgi:hypothetical protein
MCREYQNLKSNPREKRTQHDKNKKKKCSAVRMAEKESDG